MDVEPKRIVLYGAASQALVLAEILQEQGHRIVALFSDWPVSREPIAGVPVIVGADAISAWLDEHGMGLHFTVAIGDGHGAVRLAKHQFLTARGLSPLTIVHARAWISPSASIGAGSQVLCQAVIGVRTKIGAQVIVNTGAIVDHECVIEDGVHLGPGTRLSGRVTIGSCSFLGIGAVVIPDIHVGANAVVGAGAVVIRNVPDGAVVVGVPAKELRRSS